MKSIEEGALYGEFLIRHREVLRGIVGRDVVRAAVADLDPDVASFLQGVTAVTWVPVDVVESFFAAVASRVGRTVSSVHEQVGAVTTQHTMRTLWRVLSRFAADSYLVAQVPVLYRRTWNRGDLSAQLPQPGFATITLSGWPDIPDFPIRGVQIAVTQALTLTGRTQVAVECERNATGARYQARWMK